MGAAPKLRGGRDQGLAKRARGEMIQVIAEERLKWEKEVEEKMKVDKEKDTEAGEKLSTVAEERKILDETKPWENPLKNDDMFRY